VNAALKKGVKRFCHLSSIAALGQKKDGKTVTEESSWAPGGRHSVYAESKFRSEAEVWRGVEEGLEAVVIHPSVIIGPGNWKNGSGLFFDRVFHGISFYTPGITGYVDVRDVTDAMILLTEGENFALARNRKFLLNSENIEFQQFLNMIAVSLHKPGPKYRAGYYMLHFAGVVLQLLALFSGKEAILNKDIISAALRKNFYDGYRICHQFGFRYRPVSEAISHTSHCFLESLKADQE
jgi:nucleoside-diphosphate-sugar epimerase